MQNKDKTQEQFEYAYLEMPIYSPPPASDKERVADEKSSIIIIDLNKDNGLEVIDFNIL